MIWTTRAYSGPTIPYFVEFLLHCEYLAEITLLRHKITAQQREKKDKRARHSLLTPRHNSELKQGRSRRWERRRVKNDVIFYQWISQLRRSVQYVSGSKNVLRLNSNDNEQFQMEIRKFSRRRSHFSDYVELGHFTFVFCRKRQRNEKRFITQVHNDIFPFIKFFVCCRFRCRRRRDIDLLKLPVTSILHTVNVHCVFSLWNVL